MAATVELVMMTQQEDSTTVLQNAWVYWKAGGTVTILRTDAEGHLLSQDQQCVDNETDSEPTKPWIYRTGFQVELYTDVELYYSLGGKPIPNDRLNEIEGLFCKRKVGEPLTWSSQAPVNANVSLNNFNAIAAAPTVTIAIPLVKLQFTKPDEFTLWPLLWELIPDGTHDDGSPTARYYTDGLAQGASLWHTVTVNNKPTLQLTVSDAGAAAAPSAAVRPKERGLLVEGKIDAGATQVKLHLLDANGAFIPLRANAASTTAVNVVDGVLGTVSGEMKSFKAILYLNDAGAAFGPVQIQATSDGLTPPITETRAVHLAGFQTALVNDYTANIAGTDRGTPPTEADDQIVVDFMVSQQATISLLEAETRARRMASYVMTTRPRPLSATVTSQVVTPEMPLWMAELEIIGIGKDQLLDLMKRRQRQLPANPQELQFDLDWDLTLSWDGPDAHVVHPRRYLYKTPFPESQKATIRLEANNNALQGVGADGAVANAFDPAPTALDFPVTGRRLPQVVVSGVTRAWGRQQGSPAKDTILLEWQPKIVDDAGKEILRGGDGRLTLKEGKIANTPISRGLNSSQAGPVEPPAADPAMRTPRFRVIGSNPLVADVQTLADALVQEYYDAHNTNPIVTFLSVACWQYMVRRILIHESGKQFDTRAKMSQVSWVSSDWYGLENNMPIFGPPHGYGYGQHDNPRVTHDACWSFLENIRGSVKLLMGVDPNDKARVAYDLISAHLPNPLDQRIRAVYQRQVVRAYNGGPIEFVWSGGAWKIQPSLPKRKQKDNPNPPPPQIWYPNPELPYPNLLGTNVHYWTGTGAQETDFGWPITFTSAMFGPETETA